MALSNREILDVIELAYYSPALLLAILVLVRQGGMRRPAGWHYLVVLAILRLVGASTALVAATGRQPPPQHLVETSAIAYSIGTTPLLLILLGIIKRVNITVQPARQIPSPLLRVASVPIMLGLFLAVIGGLKEFSTVRGTAQTGVTYLKVDVIIFLSSFVVCAIFTKYLLFSKSQFVPAASTNTTRSSKRLIYAAALSLPFLLLRLVYIAIVTFDRTSTTFSMTSDATTAVLVQGLMSVAPEFVAVTMYLVVGLTTERPDTFSVIQTQKAWVGHHDPYTTPPPEHRQDWPVPQYEYQPHDQSAHRDLTAIY